MSIWISTYDERINNDEDPAIHGHYRDFGWQEISVAIGGVCSPHLRLVVNAGGGEGYAVLTPAQARRLGQALIDAADKQDDREHAAT